MVRKPVASAVRTLVSVSIAAGLVLLLMATALTQGVDYGADFTIEEDYTIELNEVGDAHIVDVFKYDDYYFEDFASVFEEYPNLLSRRYRGDTDVGEIENFDVDVDEKRATVTITFDSPGFAYNMDDNWAIYGFPYEPSKTRDSEMVFEGEGTLNNEFTLFEEIPFAITTTLKFPEGATGAVYDQDDMTVTYVLPYVEGDKGNFFQDNKSVFVPVFIVLMALSLLLLLYIILNSRRASSETSVPFRTADGLPPSPPSPAAAPPMAQSPAQEQAAEAPARRFCKNCGKSLKESDKAFCSNCGKPIN